MPRAASDVTRRAFLAAGVAAAVAPESSAAGARPISRALVAPADLVYERPVPRSEEGMPVGNGRMGSLVWTTPRQLKFQINRVDVYANNSATNSFFERNNDYCGGCGFVDIDFGGRCFPESGFRQRLSVYDGLLPSMAAGATARVLGWPDAGRDRPSTSRPPSPSRSACACCATTANTSAGSWSRSRATTSNGCRTRNHTRRFAAGSPRRPHRPDAGVSRRRLLLQVRRGDRHPGRAARPAIANDTEVRLTANAGAGEFTILIASAATFDPQEDVAAAALRQLDAAAAKGWTALAQRDRGLVARLLVARPYRARGQPRRRAHPAALLLLPLPDGRPPRAASSRRSSTA